MDPKHPRDRSGQNRRRQAGTKATSARPATGGSGTRNRGWQSERGRSSGARPQAREKRPVRASPAGPVSALEVSPWSGQTVQVLLVGGRCVIGKLVGWDTLANLVLEDAVEYFQDAREASSELVAAPIGSSSALGIGVQPREVSAIYTCAAEAWQASKSSTEQTLHVRALLPTKSPMSTHWQRKLGRVVLRGPSVATLGLPDAEA
jgi:small nuclear ribonucleoprotein (snRNP)-like protein